MNRGVRILTLLPILLACCAPGEAQTFYGATGLFVHPSAFVSKPRTLIFNASVVRQVTSPNDKDTYFPTSLAYTVSNRLEAGGLFVVRKEADRTRTHPGAFAKYQLLPDASSHPAFALATTYRRNDDTEWLLIGALSHSFQSKGRTLFTGHAGVKWGRSSQELGHRSDTSEYVGLEVPLGGTFRLVGETSARFDYEFAQASSIGVMWTAPNGTNLGLGFVNLGRSSGRHLFFGVGYPLGGFR